MAVAVAPWYHASCAAADGIVPPTVRAGPALFKHCKNLAYLNLPMTKLTAKGLTDFREALPDCKIEHDN